MIFNDAELLAVSDNLKENLVVFRILAPAAGSEAQITRLPWILHR
jgi:hypothetical protein